VLSTMVMFSHEFEEFKGIRSRRAILDLEFEIADLLHQAAR